MCIDRAARITGRRALSPTVAVSVVVGLLAFSACSRAADPVATLAYEQQCGVVVKTSTATLAWDRNASDRGPVLVFPTEHIRLALPAPKIVRPAAEQLTLMYELSAPNGTALTVERRLVLTHPDLGWELVETFLITPAQPLTTDLEIVRPFELQCSSSTAGDKPWESVWPLRDGWAKRLTLATPGASAEYRLADTLTGREMPELALPVVHLARAAQCQVAVSADPRFSALFHVRPSDAGLAGEIRYGYRASRVPMSGTETRRFGLWLAPAQGTESWTAAIDAFFRSMLPDVPPGPQWLHGIAMVGYDYLSDNGQGWDRDVQELARLLSPAERQHVALCFHGWYDGIGSYSFDETTGRMKDRWVAMSKTRKVTFTKEEVQQRLRKTRELGFRVLWYFGDGVLQDRGGPCYREEWNLLNEQGESPRPTWTGPDTFDKNFIRNPAHPDVASWYQKYLAALLADYGSVVDGFVWDETYYIRRGDVAMSPTPAYCDRAMFDLVGALRKQVKAFDPACVFLASDDIGVFGLVDAIGYAMVADGNYQDSWCVPAGWSFALFPNWRNTSWSCNWWPLTHLRGPAGASKHSASPWPFLTAGRTTEVPRNGHPPSANSFWRCFGNA